MSGRRAAALLLILALASSCRPVAKPHPAAMAPWTAELRDAQPEEAFAAIYVWRGRTLTFIAAHHENQVDSPSFRLIDTAYAAMRIDTLILEGFPYSRGPNAERTLSWYHSQTNVDGFVEGGETVPAMRGAIAQGAKIWGGEADDSEIRDRVLAAGFPREDLLGFYTLRSIPQWQRERRIDGGGDPRVATLLDAELARNRANLGFAAEVLPDREAWMRWYARTNGKPLDASFTVEEAGPRADGRFRSNLIAAEIGRARDSFLVERVAAHLTAGEDVMVVFGASHLMILRPALDRMLGKPCYVGDALQSAPARCRS